MVKVKNLFMRKNTGKLAGASYYIDRGETIMREIVKTSNPRTEDMMLHRIPFAAAVKFYTNATQAFFKFAFEKKKQFESDYNAFMRENNALGINIYPTRSEYTDIYFPMVAPYLMSKGTLTPLNSQVRFSEGVCANVKMGDATHSVFTSWEQFLLANPRLKRGDIITFVGAETSAYVDGEKVIAGTEPPLWHVHQIIVGARLEGGSILSYLQLNGMDISTYPDIGTVLSCDITSHTGPGEYSIAGTFVLSRKTRRGLLVSTQQFILNPDAQRVFEFLSDDGYRALPSWQTMDKAVLEGGVAENIPEYTYRGILKKSFSTSSGTALVQLVTDIEPELTTNKSIFLKFHGGNLNGVQVSFSVSNPITITVHEDIQIELYGSVGVISAEIVNPSLKTLSFISVECFIDGKEVGPLA